MNGYMYACSVQCNAYLWYLFKKCSNYYALKVLPNF